MAREAVIRLPMPHAGQIAVLEHGARFKWHVAGRRWRKTCMGVIAAVDGHGPLMPDGQPKWRGAVRGAKIIWAAPTFHQCGFGWDELRKACGRICKFDKAKMVITFPNDGRIRFRSMETPEQSEGDTADGLIVDEAPLCSVQAWEQTLRPMISDTAGWAILMGTSSGYNWYWRNHVRAKTSPNAMSWNAPTLGVCVTDKGLMREPHPLENPEFSFDEARDLWATTPERGFREQFLGEFVADGAGVFRNVRACAKAKPQGAAEEGHNYVIGADWGKVNDFTVFAVIDTTLGHLVYVDRFNQIDTQLQIGRLKALAYRFGNCPIIAELNSIGMPILDFAQSIGLEVIPFTTTLASKTKAIDGLSLAFERGDIAIPNDEDLIQELQAFESDRLPSGMYRYSAPEGSHDDQVMALAIGWSGAVNVPHFEFADLLL